MLSIIIRRCFTCDDLQLPPFAVECLASTLMLGLGIHILENIDEKLVNANAEVRSNRGTPWQNCMQL